MAQDGMRGLELAISFDQFRELPRHPAFKFEYFNDRAWINPRPRYYHACLNLHESRDECPEGIDRRCQVRPLEAANWEQLPPLFGAAFRGQIPFSQLLEKERIEAATRCLEETRTGMDGPLIESACYTAWETEGSLVGAALVTLVPADNKTAFNGFRWKEPPPPDCIAQRGGCPHLTWIFVSPLLAGHGIGTALLAAVTGTLRQLGFSELVSTFLLGNDSSMLWHWRNGFQLLSYPGSWRLPR